MKRFLQENSVFLGHSLVMLCALGGLMLAMPKAELHLALNSFHTPCGDAFFRVYTTIGNWGPYVLFSLLLFYKLGSATFIVASNLCAGLVTQIIKRIVQAPRPATFFDIANNPDILPIVDGVTLHRFNSFPSGHTTTCVAIFFALAIILNNKEIRLSAPVRDLYQYLCFILAILGAYSRIYLSQHFAADIFAGTCVALVVTGALYPLFVRWEQHSAKTFDWHIPLKK